MVLHSVAVLGAVVALAGCWLPGSGRRTVPIIVSTVALLAMVDAASGQAVLPAYGWAGLLLAGALHDALHETTRCRRQGEPFAVGALHRALGTILMAALLFSASHPGAPAVGSGHAHGTGLAAVAVPATAAFVIWSVRLTLTVVLRQSARRPGARRSGVRRAGAFVSAAGVEMSGMTVGIAAMAAMVA